LKGFDRNCSYESLSALARFIRYFSLVFYLRTIDIFIFLKKLLLINYAKVCYPLSKFKGGESIFSMSELRQNKRDFLDEQAKEKELRTRYKKEKNWIKRLNSKEHVFIGRSMISMSLSFKKQIFFGVLTTLSVGFFLLLLSFVTNHDQDMVYAKDSEKNEVTLS